MLKIEVFEGAYDYVVEFNWSNCASMEVNRRSHQLHRYPFLEMAGGVVN